MVNQVKVLVAKFKELLDAVAYLLTQAEPTRAIGYGAAVIIWLVAGISGKIPDVSFEQALLDATAAIGVIVTVVESIRAKVVSPATAARLAAAANAAATTPDPTVDTSLTPLG